MYSRHLCFYRGLQWVFFFLPILSQLAKPSTSSRKLAKITNTVLWKITKFGWLTCRNSIAMVTSTADEEKQLTCQNVITEWRKRWEAQQSNFLSEILNLNYCRWNVLHAIYRATFWKRTEIWYSWSNVFFLTLKLHTAAHTT